MSTLASSRHSHAHPRLNLTLKNNSNSNSSANTSALSHSVAAEALSKMHPDCLPLLPQHGVSSPRLCVASNVSVMNVADVADVVDVARRRRKSLSSVQLSVDDDEELDLEMETACDANIVNIVDNENERPLPLPLPLPLHEDEADDDAASCCSENSVLSVGQEQQQQAAAHSKAQAQARQQLLMSTLYRPSAFSSVSSLGAETHSASENAESPPLNRIPAPASFQEEFLRKSQLYAEELMKQQMQLMAAARVNALTAVMPLGLRPVAGPPAAASATQLSALSKMSQLQMAAMAAAAAAATQQPAASMAMCTAASSMPTGQDALAQLTATALGIAAPGSKQLLAQHPYHNSNYNQQQHQQHLNAHNAQLHDSALKFSIDNILKADFGSRLQQRLAVGGVVAAVPLKAPGGKRTTATTTTASASGNKPLNLVNATPSLSFSSTLANICSNSNDSNSTATSSSTAAVDLVKSSASAGSPAPSKSADDCNAASGTGNNSTTTTSSSTTGSSTPMVWPAWVYCTRYSDRPSSGRSPRTRKPKKPATLSNASEKADAEGGGGGGAATAEDKRPRTAFSGTQLARLKHEFNENRYLTEKRRQQLSGELGLNEAQIKIWFQNKRAKLKKSSGTKNPLALQLMAQGLYNHSTVPLTREEEELQELQERELEAAANESQTASSSPSTIANG